MLSGPQLTIDDDISLFYIQGLTEVAWHGWAPTQNHPLTNLLLAHRPCIVLADPPDSSSMGRPKGAKNASYETRRAELAQKALPSFLDAGGQPMSFRALAGQLGVDPSTLRHYFKDFDGLYQAAFEEMNKGSTPHAEALLALLDQPPRVGLAGWCASVREGWDAGLKRVFHVALNGGAEHPVRGPVVVQEFLEPILRLVEVMLGHYDERGALYVPDSRGSALMFVSPVLMALLHQDSLGGMSCRPMDLDTFVEAHVERFLVAHAVQDNATHS